jgi:hypothetical protein
VAVGSLQVDAVLDRLAFGLVALEEQNARLEARISALENGVATTD